MAIRSVVTNFQATGSSVEEQFHRQEIRRQVDGLMKKAPADKYSTLRRLLADARAGKVDREVFKEFVRRTNSFSLVAEMQDWETYQASHR